MSRIIKNIIRATGFFMIAVPIYVLFDLSGTSPIYEPGIMTTVLSVVIGASLTIMTFNFSMIPKTIENLLVRARVSVRFRFRLKLVIRLGLVLGLGLGL